ncbi:MAG: SRPBCC family protein [Myxococcales bacterium]|nr:SRPBCC family protein [Myxococcales bacterium]
MLSLSLPALLAAQPTAPPQPTSASEAALRGLTLADLAVLAPDLDRGPVLYTRFRPDEREMPEIVFATRVDAPAEIVADVIAQPEQYPEFMSALDEIEVETRQGPQLAYRWKWRIALFTLTGRNAMAVMPPHPTRGHRVEVRSTGGDMGLGRFSWRVHPDGPSRSTLVLASRVDMRGANYLADQLASGGVAVQRSINVALASVMALGTKARAEAQVGRAATPVERPASEDELTRPPLDLERLGPLLVHGDLAFLELEGDSLARVSIAARMGTDLAHTRAVMEDPEQFGRSLVHGSTARVLERSDDGVLFEWGIPLPLVGIDGRMRLVPSEGVIAVDGVSGSLRSGHWRFDTHVYAGGEAAVVGWARFDPAEASRLVRRMLAGDVALSHGLAMATQVMIVRSLRLRALGRR